MKTLVANDIDSVEAVKYVQSGGKLSCPVCSALIKTIPEAWEAGRPLHGLECPNDQKHFLIHCEDGNAMKEMRARMQARAGKI